jgi:XapX domain-containing protein
MAGMILGLLIGAACKWFDIPLPGLPKLVRAFLIVSFTVGYITTDKLIASASTSELRLGHTETKSNRIRLKSMI